MIMTSTFFKNLKEHRDLGIIDVEIHVDNEFKDHPSIIKIQITSSKFINFGFVCFFALIFFYASVPHSLYDH